MSRGCMDYGGMARRSWTRITRTDDSLSDIQIKFPCQWPTSDIVHGWMEEEPSCIAENTVVDIGILHDGTGIMPVAVENETDSQRCRCDQECPEQRKVPRQVVESRRVRIHSESLRRRKSQSKTTSIIFHSATTFCRSRSTTTLRADYRIPVQSSTYDLGIQMDVSS